ncbi:TPA: hypothetical protein ACOEAK_003176 [Enterobacter ludwigii]
MAGKTVYKKEYADRVINIALSSKKTTNKIVGIMLGVTEATVRNWRKEHDEFNRAFDNARLLVDAEVNRVLRGNLVPRKRKIITDGPKGRTVTLEEILPSHNDVAVYGKMGRGHTVLNDDEVRRDEQRTILRRIMKRKVAGDLTALEAAQLLEAEDITVPATLMYEIEKGSKDKEPVVTLTPEQRAARVEELRKKLYGGTEPEPDAG